MTDTAGMFLPHSQCIIVILKNETGAKQTLSKWWSTESTFLHSQFHQFDINSPLAEIQPQNLLS